MVEERRKERERAERERKARVSEYLERLLLMDEIKQMLMEDLPWVRKLSEDPKHAYLVRYVLIGYINGMKRAYRDFRHSRF